MKFIAELCQNHNGDFAIIEQMVQQAASVGATHIKLQHIFTKNLVFRAQFENGLKINDKTLCIRRPYAEEFSRLSSLELTDAQYRDFVSLVKSFGLIPLTTCFSRSDLPNIISQGFEEIKVASYDCSSYQLIRELTQYFSHIYVSTGATYDSEVQKTASLLKDSNIDYTLLHCITIYPTPLSSCHLKRINYLAELSLNVGYSDHSAYHDTGTLASKVAIHLGASVLERHFTVLDSGATRDGIVSIDMEGISDIIQFSRLSNIAQKSDLDKAYPDWHLLLGSRSRALSEEELLNRDYYRGRFATPLFEHANLASQMLFNYEETPLP